MGMIEKLASSRKKLPLALSLPSVLLSWVKEFAEYLK
jgi:hypothetical protein